MNITRKNFKETFPLIVESINEADFLAIDGEFTGLTNGRKSHSFDTPEERYHKLKEGTCDFLLVQFGLCTFTYKHEEKKYISKAYNFYIFPTPLNRQASDVRFLCQASSLDFLARQSFDFNKVFYEGIPYLNPAEEQSLSDALQERHNQSMNNELTYVSPSYESPAFKGPLVIPEEHKSFIADICKKIETFLKDEQETSLQLPVCTAYQRKLIYEAARKRFKMGIQLDTQTAENRDRFIVVKKASEEEKKLVEQKKREADWEELKDAVGFSNVIREITRSGKLVVGHNMMLDLMHVLHQFASPLPEDYEEFKSLAHCVFPRICDTKLMSSTNPFKVNIPMTDLGNLTKILERAPFAKPNIEFAAEEHSYSTVANQLHEAGYDAYITGLCFISMANFLGTFQVPIPSRIPANSPLLEPFVNKLYVMMVVDIPYMNLVGADLKPNRDHVFHVSFPASWRTSDIVQLFSAFGHVYIAWINDTSALVGLNYKDNAGLVMKTIGEGESYKIQTYKDYCQTTQVICQTTAVLKRKVDGSPPVKSPRPPKKRKSSGILNPDLPPTIPEEQEETEHEDLGEPLTKKLRESTTDGVVADIECTSQNERRIKLHPIRANRWHPMSGSSQLLQNVFQLEQGQ
ncbi:PREDICTED: poly(A)-specific ribonuclease PARN-like isoform X2 [Priapulus caudatus]|uniref:Poly(A)-specific ribonuclease PARN n=1 Tax=Priapulus caudatus TaxID=37621 RepID=A0ABM1DXC6_PRICU|nr:PREDICTED: poly(A)-specific ribonuclease PARN-like isoform X2 [Priapulus caudatus]